MNQQFDFSQAGGFPLSQDVLEFMQGGYSQSLGAMNNLIGHLTITAGTKNTEGWIYVVDQATGVGELLPFFAGAFSNPQFSIAESTEGLMFKDSRRKQVKITRYITRNLSNNNYNSNEVQDISYANNRGNIVDLWDKVNLMRGQVIDMYDIDGDLTTFFDGTGLGLSNGKWLGWALCNGHNGTPNLTGRVTVGVGTSYPHGQSGGNTATSLTADNLPAHVHRVTDERDPTYPQFSASDFGVISGTQKTTAPTGAGGAIVGITNTGGNPGNANMYIKKIGSNLKTDNNPQSLGSIPISIMQPYIALYKIMRII